MENLMELKEYSIEKGYLELKDCKTEREVSDKIINFIGDDEFLYTKYSEKEVHESGLDEIEITHEVEFSKGMKQRMNISVVIKIYFSGRYLEEDEVFACSSMKVVGW